MLSVIILANHDLANHDLANHDPVNHDPMSDPQVSVNPEQGASFFARTWREKREFSRSRFTIPRLALLVLLLHLPCATPAQELEQNTNRFGLDFKDFDLPSPDPHLCSKACVDNEQCRAFTYLKPYGWKGAGPAAHCWLKNAIPDAKADPCCISGVVRPQEPAPQKDTPPHPKPIPREEPMPPGKPGDWVIEKSLIGGIRGGVTSTYIKFDGHWRRRPRRGDSQEGVVPPKALQKLTAAIRAASPSTWKPSYGHDQCCDMVSTRFRLDITGPNGAWQRYSVTIYAMSSGPPDLEAVLAATQF